MLVPLGGSIAHCSASSATAKPASFRMRASLFLRRYDYGLTASFAAFLACCSRRFSSLFSRLIASLKLFLCRCCNAHLLVKNPAGPASRCQLGSPNAGFPAHS